MNQATRITAEPPEPIKVRLLKDGISVGTVVHKTGDVVSVPVARGLAMFRHGEAEYADPAMETPRWESGRLVTVGSLPLTDPVRMASEIAALQADVAELREIIATLTAPAPRPRK